MKPTNNKENFMKRILALSLLVISSLASAATMSDVVGSYKISNPDLPVLTIVTIKADGAVKLTEQSPYGKLECSGKAKLKADVLTSEVKCEDGQEFTQRINLKNVKSFGKFSALVYSSLYGQEVKMNFEKI